MTIRLPAKWEEFLVQLPESGMGYQRVDVRLAGGRLIEDVMVFNAEQIDLPEDCAGVEIRELWIHS